MGQITKNTLVEFVHTKLYPCQRGTVALYANVVQNRPLECRQTGTISKLENAWFLLVTVFIYRVFPEYDTRYSLAI